MFVQHDGREHSLGKHTAGFPAQGLQAGVWSSAALGTVLCADCTVTTEEVTTGSVPAVAY